MDSLYIILFVLLFLIIFVTRIGEYPRKKNGKKKSIVLD